MSAYQAKNPIAHGIPYDYAELLKECGTKSTMIRRLHSEGFKKARIAQFMDIRYQHVRNVLLEPIKKTDGLK